MIRHIESFFASHRILVSRVFAVLFCATVLVTSSAHEGSIVSSLLFLFGLVLVAIATVGRLWCSLYISGYKDGQLIQTGPYSLCRNPLYFFSLIGIAGIGFATETFAIGLVLIAAFLIGYPGVIRSEENFLRGKFGTEFEAYCLQTPKFFPALSGFREPDQYQVNPRLFRRTMGDVVWFVWFVGVIELVEALHEYHYFEPLILLR